MAVSFDSEFYRDITLGGVNGLAEYFETVESQLQSVREVEHQLRSAEIRDRDLSDLDEWSEWDIAFQELTGKHDVLFANFHRYSYVVLLVLFLENRLRELCYIVQKLKGGEAPPHPRRDIIKKYQEYLEALEREADAHDLFITSGEGDPCDIFAGESRDTDDHGDLESMESAENDGH